MDGAGSFGTNAAADAAADAALISQAVGRPVRVQWSREDDLGWDPKGPPQLLDMRGALDSTGAHARLGNHRLAARQHAGAAERAAAGADRGGKGAAGGLSSGAISKTPIRPTPSRTCARRSAG